MNLDALRPYKGYNSIRETDNVASSLYNSLQVSCNKRFSNGFLFGIAYTLSKTMDNGSAQRDIIPDTYDASNLWGQSGLDVRHVFIANYLYELPFFRNQKNFAGKVLGGWQISGITQFQTGTPCQVVSNNDYAGVGQDGNWDSCGGGGPVLGDQRRSRPWCTSLRRTARNGSSAVVLRSRIRTARRSSRAPAKGTFNLQPNVRSTHPQPRFRELERRSVQEVRDDRKHGLPVPRRGVRCLQPSELERGGFQSDQRHVRQDDGEEQRAEHSALVALLLLNIGNEQGGRGR